MSSRGDSTDKSYRRRARNGAISSPPHEGLLLGLTQIPIPQPPQGFIPAPLPAKSWCLECVSRLTYRADHSCVRTGGSRERRCNYCRRDNLECKPLSPESHDYAQRAIKSAEECVEGTKLGISDVVVDRLKASIVHNVVEMVLKQRCVREESIDKKTLGRESVQPECLQRDSIQQELVMSAAVQLVQPAQQQQESIPPPVQDIPIPSPSRPTVQDVYSNLAHIMDTHMHHLSEQQQAEQENSAVLRKSIACMTEHTTFLTENTAGLAENTACVGGNIACLSEGVACLNESTACLSGSTACLSENVAYLKVGMLELVGQIKGLVGATERLVCVQQDLLQLQRRMDLGYDSDGYGYGNGTDFGRNVAVPLPPPF